MASGDTLRATFHTAIVVGLLGCGPKPAASTEGPVATSTTMSSQAGSADLGQCPTYMGAPASDADRDMLWNGRANAQPFCLFISSVAWAEHDRQKASDLFALAMVRYQYDAVRCATPIAGPVGSAMTAGRMAAGGRLSDLGILVGPEEIGAAARRSETYNYPIRHLQTLCDGDVLPEVEWPSLQRNILQTVADATARAASETP